MVAAPGERTRRVTFVATSYPRDPDDAAGHFVRAEVLAERDRGCAVSIVAPEPCADRGVSALAVGSTRLFSWPGAAARARAWPPRLVLAAPFAARAMVAISRARPELVIAHWLVPCAWPLALAGGSAELHVVCHGADVRLLVALPLPWRERIVASVLDRAAQVRFVAHSLLELLVASLPASTATRLADRATVRPPRVHVLDRSRVLTPQRPYAVVLGRLVRSKSVELAIAACELAGMDLVIIGSGPEEPALRRASGPFVRFLGQIGRRAALGHLQAASVLLHPSHVDAAPTAVIEARALSLPVITCGVGDTRRWAETDPGIRVVAREAEAFAAAMHAL